MRDWQIPWVLWKYGEQAFSGSGDSTAFNQLYEELRVNWYVFRGAKSVKMPKSA